MFLAAYSLDGLPYTQTYICAISVGYSTGTDCDTRLIWILDAIKEKHNQKMYPLIKSITEIIIKNLTDI